MVFLSGVPLVSFLYRAEGLRILDCVNAAAVNRLFCIHVIQVPHYYVYISLS